MNENGHWNIFGGNGEFDVNFDQYSPERLRLKKCNFLDHVFSHFPNFISIEKRIMMEVLYFLVYFH